MTLYLANKENVQNLNALRADEILFNFLIELILPSFYDPQPNNFNKDEGTTYIVSDFRKCI